MLNLVVCKEMENIYSVATTLVVHRRYDLAQSNGLTAEPVASKHRDVRTYVARSNANKAVHVVERLSRKTVHEYTESCPRA
jgi:hypothetical protein